MRKVVTLVCLVLTMSFVFSAEYKIIRLEDGQYVLSADDAKAIAEYILKLEQLNENYKQQINMLEQMNENLKLQLDNLQKQVNSLKSELTAYKAKEVAGWVVVAAIVIGGIVYLFVQ